MIVSPVFHSYVCVPHKGLFVRTVRRREGAIVYDEMLERVG